MNLLPWYRVDLQTSDSADLVASRLTRMVAVGWFLFSRPDKPFRGRVTDRHFKVVPVLGTVLGLPYRNSFQPVIEGDIVDAPPGTLVRVRMRLNALVALVLTVWFGIWFCLAALMLCSILAEGLGTHRLTPQGAGVALPVAGAMLFFGYSMVNISFWTEVKKGRRALCNGLGCVEAHPATPARAT